MRQLRSKIIVFICLLFFSSFFFALPALANNNANTNNSLFSVNSTSVPADGSTTATISITVRDDANNAVSGDTVTLTSTGDSGLVINGGSVGADNATATTDSNGNVSFAVSSNNPNPGTDTFTASDTSDNPSIPLGSTSSITVTFTTPNSCAYGTPGTPQLTSAVANGNSQIMLTWTDVANPVSYYLVSYGIAAGQYIYGNPNVGEQGTTSYTVGNLAKGTTYYFVVKAVNGCTPGSFSNEVSATTAGGVAAATPTPTPDTSLDTTSQNNVAPTDTPTPTENIQPTTTPTPAPTSVAGTSDITMLVGIIAFILIVGGIGWFIYWKHQKNKQLPTINNKENQQDEASNQDQPQSP
ncbi:MAG TPA: fibronectin type III domain-containing protein [Patescibacteria group bacterium]|jgi:cbb3-type cytochrome oxidase subunit 3|nr:fibronectin type III domain-containing protein [Patescibacteria group bacterium]